MQIAISATGPTLDSAVEARFGRCPYFILIDPDTLTFEAIPNPNTSLSGGAGIQSAQMMAAKGVTAVLTGRCGPNAIQVFGAAGIQVVDGVSGTVRQAVEGYKSGKYTVSAAPAAQAGFGPGGQGRGMGSGRGMGRGRGMGGGRGGGGRNVFR